MFANLRPLMAKMELEMSALPADQALRSTWGELVAVLALGPEPQTRVCPRCGGVGMRAASRCGNCWVTLERLPETP
jgi:hypothetical protein